ncbi:LPS export ABC transporter periplasmic protein LptC [Natronospora cellulosivora (SeqCode)]
MRDKKTLLLSFGLIIVIVGIFSSLFFYDNQTYLEESHIENDIDYMIPDNLFKDVELLFFNEDASIAWYIESAELKNYTKESFLELMDIEISVLDLIENDINKSYDFILASKVDSARKIYDLIAYDSRYDINEGRLELYGPIKIARDDLVFETSYISMQDGENLFYAKGGVSIQSTDFLLTGEKIEADLALNNITISGNEEEQVYLTW